MNKYFHSMKYEEIDFPKIDKYFHFFYFWNNFDLGWFGHRLCAICVLTYLIRFIEKEKPRI